MSLNSVRAEGKPLLAFDADGVIIDQPEAFRQFLNMRLGKNVQSAEIISYGDDHAIWGVSLDVMDQLWADFDAHENSPHLPAIEGAMEACARLKEHFRLAIITGRPDHLRDMTRAWFERTVPVVEVLFAAGRKNAQSVSEERLDKWQTARKLRAIALVDDNPHEFDGVDHCGVQPICFAQPWNWGVQQVPRHDWKTLPDYLIGLIGEVKN